jgi:hypothetical protein
VSYEFDVFISYASRDGGPFVADLTARLRSSGLTVWFDQEQMRPGDEVNDALAAGLRRSQHAIFVLTRAWLDSDYTNWELRVFREQDHARRMIPVSLIGTPRDEELGPRLSGLKWLDWPPHADPDEKFWAVYCGLRELAPGPPAEWKARGRQAQAKESPLGGASLETTAREEPRATAVMEIEAPVVFGCDRKAQWGSLTTHAATTRSEALFVVGRQGQAHYAFLARVQNCLPKDPPRRIVSIHWDPPYTPIGRGQFLAALQRAFECRSDAQLIAEMRAQLTDQNLLLVHRPVAEDAFDRDDLVQYYTEWLPELVGAVDPEARAGDRVFGLKAIQAVSWLPRSLMDGLSAWVPWRSERAASAATASARAADRMLSALRQTADPRLPIAFLEELHDITVEDVKEWSALLPPQYDRDRLAAQALMGARDSAAILEKIGALLARDRRPDS